MVVCLNLVIRTSATANPTIKNKSMNTAPSVEEIASDTVLPSPWIARVAMITGVKTPIP